MIAFPSLVDNRTKHLQEQLKGCRIVDGKLTSIYAPGMRKKMQAFTEQSIVEALALIDWLARYRRQDFLQIAGLVQSHLVKPVIGASNRTPALDFKDPRKP